MSSRRRAAAATVRGGGGGGDAGIDNGHDRERGSTDREIKSVVAELYGDGADALRSPRSRTQTSPRSPRNVDLLLSNDPHIAQVAALYEEDGPISPRGRRGRERTKGSRPPRSRSLSRGRSAKSGGSGIAGGRDRSGSQKKSAVPPPPPPSSSTRSGGSAVKRAGRRPTDKKRDDKKRDARKRDHGAGGGDTATTGKVKGSSSKRGALPPPVPPSPQSASPQVSSRLLEKVHDSRNRQSSGTLAAAEEAETIAQFLALGGGVLGGAAPAVAAPTFGAPPPDADAARAPQVPPSPTLAANKSKKKGSDIRQFMDQSAALASLRSNDDGGLRGIIRSSGDDRQPVPPPGQLTSSRESSMLTQLMCELDEPDTPPAVPPSEPPSTRVMADDPALLHLPAFDDDV